MYGTIYCSHTEKERKALKRVSHDSFRDISIQWMVPTEREREREICNHVLEEKKTLLN